MSGILFALRPFHQETANFADLGEGTIPFLFNRDSAANRKEGIMEKIITRVVAATAAGATTLVLFSAVVALADDDKARVIAARIKPTTIAAQSVDAIRR